MRARAFLAFLFTLVLVSSLSSQNSAEKLAADTPKTTVLGNPFIAPKDWSVRVKGPATIIEAPEGDSWIALVDVKDAKTADEALAAAWKAYKPDAKWPVKVTSDLPDRDGWSKRREYDYQTSPNEKRGVGALTYYSGTAWTVIIEDLADATAEKRGGQADVIFSRLLPKGYSRETFAGKKANRLDQARIAELSRFVEQGIKETGVPGVSFGLVQDGKVVFADGFGVKELGKSDKPDADTLFMIASNTKALTTLMLARLVDEKKLNWDTPVTQLFPSFKLGDEATTKSVLVKHLICACTGMPRQDLEWLFEYGKMTPESSLALLGTMQPTSKFGELFQYSNLMAAAAGYTAAHVVHPDTELGKGYDEAMQSYVFDPLGMKATTLSFDRALAANHSEAHSPDINGKPAKAPMNVNEAVAPLRPAGGAWSNINDMLKYVSMELANGKLPDGSTYVSKEALLQRRAPQVAIGKDVTYGMGLEVDTTYGVPVVHHGGDLIGHHSDMIWLPDQNVGAVILTNGDPGWLIRGRFSRKLLEVVFDGRKEADAELKSDADSFYAALAAERKLMTVPADATESAKLAKHYSNASLGDVDVSQSGSATIFDFGEWKSEMSTRKNPDGTISFITILPGMEGSEFVVGSGPKKTLTMRDAQHEYVFESK
ncbi:beta-lactamase [Candidatus Koribacter versatilis Ellin345]|uniref:Beta-lactamase n=1 Tax=Koribacter versatilis (strain Ellin345) TaxID=204669 RepID=Q1IMC0_KORVE|nr:serine hydrolase domain-containing protein [Candidatus Koribacter versatilis]ABF41980.1 beta-lactamase [Candidatus Koribacter versatilis Ellin345]